MRPPDSKHKRSTALKIVVKMGGRTLDDPALLAQCAKSVCSLVQEGHQVAVVHGGGAALTRTLARMGKESHFINGLRVTDAETRDVALMVLSGQLNKMLVAAVIRAGQPAIGMSGGDGASFRARKKVDAAGDLG